MSTQIHQFVEEAKAQRLDRLIGRMDSGWAVLGPVQVVEGYCLLLPDPVVPHLNSLRGDTREQFLTDMARLGDAVLAVTGAARINYEILGNLEPALHAHVFPRFSDEPEELRTKPIWFYDWESAPKFDPNLHAHLLKEIKQELGL